MAQRNSQRLVGEVVKRWINRPTMSSEAFTALHFSAYHGNVPMITYLLDLHADPLMHSNPEGINAVHVAA